MENKQTKDREGLDVANVIQAKRNIHDNNAMNIVGNLLPEKTKHHTAIYTARVINDLTAIDNFNWKVIKRIIDIIFSILIIILVLSWFIPLMAIIIKLDSRGPVFFKQQRNGYCHKPFTCIKFRSMVVNLESNRLPAQEGDKRITRVGKILRRYYIDELPQFINVLLGDMTLVGPRPHMLHEDEMYEDVIPNYSFRFMVKPGITGLAQINTQITTSSLPKMKHRLFWDTLYIKNWSHSVDLWILFQTLRLCVNGEKNKA